MQLGTAAGEHNAVAVDVTGQLRRGLFQHLVGRGADLLTEHHHRLVQVIGGHVHAHRQAGEQAAALDLHGLVEICLLGAAGHVLFQVLSGALADGDAELVAHELQDLFVVVVAGHADAGGLDLAAEAQHGDVGGAAADVDDHPAVWHGDVDAGAESCGDRLINERKIFHTSMVLSLVCCGLLSLVFVVWRNFFLQIYTTDPAVLLYAKQRIVIATTLECLTSVYEISAGAMRGLGRSLTPALITFLGSCVLRLIWIATACKMVHEFWVLLIIYPISWVVTGLIMMIAYEIVKKRVLERKWA